MKYFNSVSEIIPWIRGAGGSLINLKGEEALAELEAIVARDADVQTLDEWAARTGVDVPVPGRVARDTWCVVLRGRGLQLFGRFEGPTPDAARHEAAKWVRSC